MKQIDNPATEILLLYLQKLELLEEYERKVFTDAIKLISQPIFITGQEVKIAPRPPRFGHGDVINNEE